MEKDPQIRKRRTEYARQNSWSIRVEQLIGIVDKYLDKKQRVSSLQLSEKT
jgi:hypothetical protein